ncbi:MAG TPA: glycoside hydrolase family 5 protein, partial [Spirochaetota bacterium]
MKALKRLLCVTFIIIGLSVLSCISVQTWPAGISQEEYREIVNEKIPSANAGIPGKYPPQSAVFRYGKLQVKGTQLCDEKGNPIQLCGVFLRALQNESKFINREVFATMVHDWKIEILRVPFMSAQWYSEPSYINNEFYEKKIDDAVQLCEEFGIYCVIDWHVLGDGNPFIHARESREFFKKLAFKYGAKKHVIYELCNEPNGYDVSWNNVIRPYAEFVIPAIHAGDPDALIIVGTSTWSQDVDIAAENPLAYKNILYAFHFYSGTHTQPLRDKVEAASHRIALFSSEWGNSDCFARNGPYIN